MITITIQHDHHHHPTWSPLSQEKKIRTQVIWVQIRVRPPLPSKSDFSDSHQHCHHRHHRDWGPHPRKLWSPWESNQTVRFRHRSGLLTLDMIDKTSQLKGKHHRHHHHQHHHHRHHHNWSSHHLHSHYGQDDNPHLEIFGRVTLVTGEETFSCDLEKNQLIWEGGEHWTGFCLLLLIFCKVPAMSVKVKIHCLNWQNLTLSPFLLCCDCSLKWRDLRNKSETSNSVITILQLFEVWSGQ